MTNLTFPDKRHTAPFFKRALMYQTFDGNCDACGQVFEHRTTDPAKDVACLLCYFVDRIGQLEVAMMEGY